MRVYVVRKWPLRGRSRFVCWSVTRVSLWLLCNVHFVQSTQRTRLQTKTIRAWYKQFTETGCLCEQKSSGRPLTVEDDAERVRASFPNSPKKSKGTAANELSISKTTVWRVLGKRLVFKPYRIQMVHNFRFQINIFQLLGRFVTKITLYLWKMDNTWNKFIRKCQCLGNWILIYNLFLFG